jgi:hypothetical protein
VIPAVPADRPFQVRAVTVIHPEQQTDLEGLFCVEGVYATQVRACHCHHCSSLGQLACACRQPRLV